MKLSVIFSSQFPAVAFRATRGGGKACLGLLMLMVLLSACGGGKGGGTSGSASGTGVGGTTSLAVTVSGTGTVGSSPSGISCTTGTCNGLFTTGTTVTLSETPGTNYVFAGWSGGTCTGSLTTCSVPLTAAKTVTANFSPVASTYTLTVARGGTGTGTVTSNTGGISCGSTCSATYASGATVILTAAASSGNTFTGWSGGGCSGVGNCSVSMVGTQNVTANFTANTGACTSTGATTVANLVENSSGTGFTTNYTLSSSCPIETTYGTVNGICYGNYVINPNTYGNAPANTTLSMWSQSASCWGIVQYEPNNAPASPTFWNGPTATRGFSMGPNTLLTPSGGIQVSTLNSQYNSAAACPSTGAAQSVCAKWTMSVPGISANSVANTATNYYTTWDALLDIYFHTVAVPATFSNTAFDLQIYQMLMDFQVNGVPNWATFMFSGRYTTKTISGVQYFVNVNMFNPGTEGSGWIGSGGTHNAISLVPVASTPTTLTAGSSGSYLWGVSSVVHDVGGIIKWLSQTTTVNGTTGIHDDAGNLLWDNVRNAAVTTALLDPTYYLTGLNPGFEVVQTTNTGTYPNNAAFTTTNLWIALPGETVGN